MARGPAPARPHGIVSYGSARGRWVLLATVLGSGIAALDATVVNVALPAIGEDLGADLAGLQWTLNGYLLTLASFMLLGGSLGDRFGRRSVFVVGVVWFAVASLLCGLALSMPMLIAARAFQGLAGALLTPGSLAILQASFSPGDRARAIGAWSGLGGVATAVGPFAGGWLVDALSWRYIFLLNLPLAALVVVVALRHVPESRNPQTAQRLDAAGAVLGAAGLAGVTYALIEAPARGGGSPLIVAAAAVGVLGLVGFVLVERRSRHPMLPVEIFASRQFTGANLVTVAVYAALGGVFFLLVVHLQQVLGYSALAAGSAMFPVTVIMLALSARAGELATRIGPRLPMTLGPFVVSVGLLLMTRIVAGSAYLSTVLPAALVFGLGLALTVAPLTATVLAAAPERHAGVASGVNNAVARAAGLLAVAILPLLAGLGGGAYRDPRVFAAGFRTAVVIAAGLCALGGVIAWLTIRDDVLVGVEPQPATGPARRPQHSCPLDAPPLRTSA
jgi:EmrB/QacA subfamily drug resistance transporter